MRRFVMPGAVVVAVAAVAVPVLAQTGETERTWPSQTSAGEVTLEATPTWNGEALVITLVANTHSVDLASIDLGRSVRLFVGGAEHAPAWSGSLDGHHGQARVVFELPEPPASFKLEIRDVDQHVTVRPSMVMDPSRPIATARRAPRHVGLNDTRPRVPARAFDRTRRAAARRAAPRGAHRVAGAHRRASHGSPRAHYSLRGRGGSGSER